MKKQGYFTKRSISVLSGGCLGATIALVGEPHVDEAWVVGGALIGIILGAVLGQYLQRTPPRNAAGVHTDAAAESAYQAFLTTTFAVMGYLARVEGQNGAKEVHAAQVIMGYLHLSKNQQRQAARSFEQGKQADFSLNPLLQWFHSGCRDHAHFLRKFIEIQLSVAYANGFPSARKRAVLSSICGQLGFANRFKDIEARIHKRVHRASAASHQRNYVYGYGQGLLLKTAPMIVLQRAYRVLGLRHDATDEEVKKAYRRLISRHHPDRLIAQGASDDAMAQATEATRTVREAYELIKTVRGSL